MHATCREQSETESKRERIQFQTKFTNEAKRAAHFCTHTNTLNSDCLCRNVRFFFSLSLFLSFFIRSFSRTHCIASNSSTYYFNFSETLKFEKVSNEFFFIGYISIEWVVQVVVWCMCVDCLSVCPFVCITFWKQRFNKFDCENRISR